MDEVIIGAPYSVTNHVLEKVYPVDVVIHGNTLIDNDLGDQDPYLIPKQKGIYKEIISPRPDLTTDVIISRILENRKLYEERNRKKKEKADHEELLLKQEKQKLLKSS